jgi:separase
VTPQLSSFLSDLTTRSLDSLFTLAKSMLKVNDPRTHSPSYDHLARAATILASVSASGIPLANYLRCLSGAYYNLAGCLYQAGRHGPAIPFLKEACTMGTKALVHRLKETNDGEEKVREQQGWKQLEETLFRRLELLGICYIKIGDRKVSSSSPFLNLD